MTTLAIVDPALSHSRGHHLAALEHISGAVAKLKVFGGSARDVALCEVLAAHSIEYVPIFSRPFYGSLENAPVSDVCDYVRQLAREYVRVFESAAADCFLYHTLSWEHAKALALAFEYCRRTGNSVPGRHLVFTMFNPGVSHRGKIIDAIAYCRFESGFGQICRQPGVKLYAPSHEYAVKYQQLLAFAGPLPLHPVFFDHVAEDQARGGGEGEKVQGAKSIEILYLGDAKTEKGFRRLPDLIRQQLEAEPEKHFVVQYSSNGEEVLLPFEAELEALAALEQRFVLHRGFVSHKKLEELLSGAERVTLDYDPQYYGEKSSGVLWLALARNVTILAPAGTWLRREASRLSILAEGSEWNEARDFEQINQYRKQVFCPFDEWFSRVMAGEE